MISLKSTFVVNSFIDNMIRHGQSAIRKYGYVMNS